MRFWMAAVLFAAAISALAQAPAAPAPAPAPTPAPAIPAAPQVDAKSWLVMDMASGQMLVEKNIDERVEPASLTKIMTAYVVASELKSGRIKMDDMVTISERAWKRGYKTDGSKMFIEVGKQVSVGDLLKGVVIASGNDACVALAEHAAGTEEAFVDLMNAFAKKLGMTGTHFVNSDGLPDPNHYSTARDLAILSAALIRDFPEEYALHSVKEYAWNGITQQNRNDLLWRDPSVDGVKTGHHEAAGYCLIASALRDGMRLISVVMGSNSTQARASASQALLNYAFRFYESRKVVAAGEALATPKVWKGAAIAVPLGLAEDLVLTLPRGSQGQLERVIEPNPNLMAPIARGDALGTFKLKLGGKELVTRPLVALEAVEPGSVFRRFMDEIFLILE